MATHVPSRQDYLFFHPISTRWNDNDMYGHVNNVTYYSYFDTAANIYLIEQGVLDIHTGSVAGFVVNSSCSYHAAISYPDQVEVGLRVDKIGNSSVQYGLAIFKNDEAFASANGHFVHVFVDRTTTQSIAIPENIRRALSAIHVAAPEAV